MNVVAVIDSFKGSISSIEAGNALRAGVCRVYPEASVKVLPLADGGEGTVDALVGGLGGEFVFSKVLNPVGSEIYARYGIINNDTAVIEMAAASGITLISPSQRDPLKTTTYGVGQLIRDAISKGCRKFIIGIGGSATNDGGVGMLKALGFGFYDSDGKEIPLRGEGLRSLDRITAEGAMPELSECEFRIACDVTNPLCGENGCSAVYGPQKGATPETVRDMDAWLDRYAKLTKEIYPEADAAYPGTGAAGGLGFAFLAYLNAVLQSGVSLVLDAVGAEDSIKEADIVVTGEGRLDSQSVMGKAPTGVARLAKKYNKTVIAFAGCLSEDAELCNQHGIDAFFPILRGVVSLEDAMNSENAKANLEKTAEQVFRVIKTCREREM